MGFCAGAKDEMMNNRATFGTVGKFPQLTADLTSGVIGKKVQGDAEEEYQHHDSLPEEVLKLLKPMAVCKTRVYLLDIIGSAEALPINTKNYWK